jgi:protein required for attachment to host cells
MGAVMHVRIVTADQAEARYFDAMGIRGPLKQIGTLRNPAARLHARDLNADRAGRTIARAVGGAPGRRGGRRHAFAGEGDSRHRSVKMFARRIALDLDVARRAGRFNRLVIVAGPVLLGELRAALSPATRACVVQSVDKDLVHEGRSDVSRYLSPDAFARLAGPASSNPSTLRKRP